LQADGYDEPIRTEDFALEKTLLFEIDPPDAVSDLNKKKISAKLEGRFRDSKIDLSRECTIESQQWLITNGEPQFLLSKRENNEVDVCAAADGKYLFSLDEGFETDLNEGKISTDLQQAFRDQNVVLRQDSDVSVVSWFISDIENQKHYLIENKDKRLKVYRDYKLPLLRMARLSANVLLCLFEGVVQTVDLHLKPETLHFGLDKPQGDHKVFYKKLKGFSLFSVGDFIDLPAFVAKLCTQDPISKYLWNQFSASTQGVLTSATSTPEEQKLALVQALDKILKGVLIYETVRFAGVALSPETLELRSQNPKGKDLIRLNRLLLEDAYPLEIAKSQLVIDSIPWKDQATQVIEIAVLAKKIQDTLKAEPFSAAEFAIEMIEGAQKVRFCASGAGTIPK
jgi:hypothetical protein